MSKLDIKFKRLSPFKRCVLQNFPFIEEDFDALTNYGLLCKIVAYLNSVIASQNEVLQDVSEFEENVTENFEALRDKFVELKAYVDNYFNNLDVQEEINNKLDQMVEDGILQEIIGEYLNATAVWGFDNVADMKSSTNLINGSYARTLGYYAKNDGGGALYKIRNVTNDDVIDEATIIEMNDSQNTLVAELVLDVVPNVNQFGAYGDGIHDDTTAIQKAFNCTKIKTLAFIGRCTYLISDEITLYNRIALRCNGALIKANHADACIFISGNIYTLQHVYDFNFDGNFVANVGLKVSDCRSLHCIQPHIVNVIQKGIYVFRNASSGYGAIRLEGFHIENKAETPEQQTAIANSTAIYLANTDSEILNGDIKDFKIGVRCSSSTVIYGVHHWNWIDSLVEDSIMIDAYGGVRITNCYADGIPIFVKQNVDTQYSNTEIVSAIYNYAISQEVTATPCPIYKGSHAHVNVVDSSFDASYTNPDTNTSNWAICNNFQNFFSTNVFCVRCYLENYYKGKLEDENIGTLYYERVNDVVYYNFFNSGTASSNATFADRLPTWACPSRTIRTSLTSTSTSLNAMLSITNNGEVTNVTTGAYSYGNASYSARYALQSANV